MKLLTCFVLVLFHIEEINAAWNISENGFLLNSLRYSNIRNTDYFSVVFWTTNHNGILLYCEGKDNYLLLELYHAVIRLSVNYIGQERQEPYEGYVGSGLADNKPHQIEIYRESHSIMLVLDRGEQTALVSWPVVSSSQLLFKISTAYLGGYNDMSIFNRFMSLSKTGFIGCIEEGIWNNVNLLFEPYANNSVSFCTLTSYDPISFLSPTSFITLNRKEHATGLTLIFDIMIYLNYSTILFHNNNLSTLNISITNGSFFMSLDFGNVNYINAFLPMIKINDGQWHRIAVQLPGKNSLETPIVVFGVDNEIVTTYSSFTYDASRDIKFGGFGFIGCINNLVVDGESFIMGLSSETRDVDNNGCHFPDQCVPNPCQHAGFCTLNVNSFNCQCPLSYPGVVCEDAKYYLTCSNMYLCDHKIPGKQLIDVDGIGPFDPVPVLCNNMEASSENNVVTQVDNLLPLGRISLKNEPTTESIPYALTLDELRLLTLNSYYCTQEVNYECSSSRITSENSTLLVWKGGDGLMHDYWNSQHKYGACQCYVENKKCDQNQRCNCDVNDRITRSDSTTLNNKDHLPIIGITAMDISSSTGKSATIEIGPLICVGVGGRLNGVTFQEIFSYLPLPKINFANPGSISFQFRTDRAQGNTIIFAQGRPNEEYYIIELSNSYTVTAYFSLGSKQYTLVVEIKKTMPILNNLEWHTVSYKIGSKTAYLIVDGIFNSLGISYEYDNPIQVNKDNTPFFVGGSPYNMFSGYRGTVRKLKINDEMLDLPEIVNQMILAPVGVYPGLYSSCTSAKNPCNYGECKEHFNFYICDCNISPFNGKNCENEIGVVFDNTMNSLSYFFTANNQILEFTISIAFRTTRNGLLYFLQGMDQNIFISMDIFENNLRLTINLWPQRTKVPNTYIFYNTNSPYIFTNGKPYVVQFKFEASMYYIIINGRENIIILPVNNPEDLYFTNPRWLYLGTAPILNDFPALKYSQYIGCLGGMKMKLKYQGKIENEVIDVLHTVGSSPNTKVGNNVITNSLCIGNLTSPPPAKLIPTPPNMIPGGGNPISTGTNATGVPNSVGTSWGPVLAACLILLAFMLLLGTMLFLRWYSRNHGVYVTQEGVKLNQSVDKIQTKKRETPSVALPQVSIDEMEGWYL